MKLPRVIRLDQSDVYVFEPAAEAGELAVPGGFAFAGRDPAALAGKQQLAFRNGWLGLDSFGRASLVEVAEVEEADFFAAVERLARHFVEAYGAPALGAALPVARLELEEASGLCEHKLHTLLSLERDLDEAGELVERFRVVLPERAADHAPIWRIVEDGEA
ncbi:MAG: DUF6505 family protein [Tistlia sp.]|uniref:DUF6505 family protein n=1 Tax=Tistlia sp. TaxID=3057121 RepID=UPI0034A1D9FB